MLENRRHLRFKERFDMTWTIPGENAAGQGQILNVSSSGLQIQIDDKFVPLDNGLISIDTSNTEEKLPFSNKKGKVVWFRKIAGSRFFYQCGVEFLNQSAKDEGLIDWIDQKTSGMSVAMSANILNNYMA